MPFAHGITMLPASHGEHSDLYTYMLVLTLCAVKVQVRSVGLGWIPSTLAAV